MKKKATIIVLTLIIVSFSSCYNYQSLRLLQENSSLPKYEKSDFVDYHIQINDELIFRLITTDETISKLIAPQNGSTSGQNQISYRVYTDGTIDIPFVSKIAVVGLTVREANKVIEDKLKELIPDAEVKLDLAYKTYTLFGDIGSGIYSIYKDKLTIFQALAQSGDFNEGSDRRHIRIIRGTGKDLQILEFDIRPKSIINSKYYYIYPNDIIYVRREFSTFYKVNNYTGILGLITFSISLLFNVLVYTKK